MMLRTLLTLLLLVTDVHAPILHCKRLFAGGEHSWVDAGGAECAVMHPNPTGGGWYAKIKRLPTGPPITAAQRKDGTLETNEAIFATQTDAEAGVEKFCRSDDPVWK